MQNLQSDQGKLILHGVHSSLYSNNDIMERFIGVVNIARQGECPPPLECTPAVKVHMVQSTWWLWGNMVLLPVLASKALLTGPTASCESCVFFLYSQFNAVLSQCTKQHMPSPSATYPANQPSRTTHSLSCRNNGSPGNNSRSNLPKHSALLNTCHSRYRHTDSIQLPLIMDECIMGCIHNSR